MGLAVSGLATGLDVDGIIGQLMQLERRPIELIQRRITRQQQRLAAVAALQQKANTVNASAALITRESLFARGASSSDEGIATITAGPEATIANHELTVSQLAHSHRLAAQGFADIDETGIAAHRIGSDVLEDQDTTPIYDSGEGTTGTFEFTVGGGDAVRVALDDGDTLDDLADAINDEDAGITASVVEEDDEFRLVLSSDTSGEDGEIEIVTNDTDLGFSDEDLLAIQIGDEDAVTIEGVTFATTLQELVELVNEADAGVTASVVSDGSGANPHRLVLTSSTTGTVGTISLSKNFTDLDLSSKGIDEAELGAANSGDYTGEVESSAPKGYTGTGNKTFIIEIITEGSVEDARYKFSVDGGLSWDDNDGDGFVLATSALDLNSFIGNDADLGEGIKITFEDDGSTLAAGDRFSVDAYDPDLRRAQDAVFTVDGLTIVQSDNTVEDILNDVTLDLHKADPDTTLTLSITRDLGLAKGNISGLVASYNSFATFINDQSAYDAETGVSGALSGDAAVRSIGRTLRSLMGSQGDGLADLEFDSLASIGISSDVNGLYSVDETKLTDVLEENPEAIAKIFHGFGELDTDAISFVSKTVTTLDGTYTVNLDEDDDGERVVTIGGLETTIDGETVKGKLGTDLEGLVITIEDLDTIALGDLGDLTLFRGITDHMQAYNDDWNEADDGLYDGKKNAIESSIESMNERIEEHETRLLKVEARLRKKFNSLEVLVSRLNAQSDFLGRQLSQLENMSKKRK